ncbi:MAG: sodium/solute symporter [bacterium]|nr:sodium/solute symporter [bacterium]
MRYLDLAVIVAYLLGITWFGARFRHSQRSLRDYFLGGRSAPWWAICFSIVSTETSTLTIIGTPALAYAGNLGFLQVVFGYLVGRIVIAVLFLPHYFRGEMYTAYELMEVRFGERLRKVTAGLFLVLRALAEAVRVFAVAIVISVVLGTGEVLSIFLILCLTLLYVSQGGMKAVIWTDVIQMILYVVGGLLSLVYIVGLIDGGWRQLFADAAGAGKLRLFDFDFELTAAFFRRKYTFWAGLIGGGFLATASHGTEQLLVQRLLAARSQADSRKALLVSWVVVLFQFVLFLVVGLALWVYYRQAGLTPPATTDRLYPEFIWQELPIGLAGLLVAAILAAAMSTLSSSLSSLASTTLIDFYLPLRRRAGAEPSEAATLALGRYATLAWGVVLFGVGLLARQWGSVLEAGLSVASVLYGSLLGVFLLGILPRRVGEPAGIAGMIAGFATMMLVKFGTSIAWTWYVVIGAVVTFAVGYAVSFLTRERQNV